MADICIVYARSSSKLVARLVEILSAKYSVWWDQKIHSGDYRGEIERQLAAARCVVPIWCKISRNDADVIDEASFALRKRIPLLPVRLEDVDAPLGFGSLHMVDLLNWTGDPAHSGIVALLRNLDAALQTKPPLLPRPRKIRISDKEIGFPAFFRSVSSYETPLRPSAAVRALALMQTDNVLVSAYDLFDKLEGPKMVEELKPLVGRGSPILVDSGNYEAYRKEDKQWTPEKFRDALQLGHHDFAFSFDGTAPPPGNVDALLRTVLAGFERDTKYTKAPILPIVHTPILDGSIRRDLLPEAMKRVARELKPLLLAVPERELGDGLAERARTVRSIRRSLDELGFYQPFHLLGTGNPISIAVLAAAGADCFDGLEWCRTVADNSNGTLYHFQQYDFFRWQDEFAVSPIVREAATDSAIGYSGKVVFHNLEFFNSWMGELQEASAAEKLMRFLASHLPKDGLRMLERAAPEVFA